MSGNCIATGKIVNNTNYDLWVVNSAVNSGHWNQTPVNVAAGKTNTSAFITQGTSGTATGTSGWVQYSVHTTNAIITVGWDDAYSSSNTTGGTGSSSSSFTVTASVPSSGSNVTFTYTVDGSA
jgi:hypothetical protein